eukprot:25806_1
MANDILSSSEAEEWLCNTVKLPQYLDAFVSNGFELLSDIQEIDNETLKEVGISKLGHQKRLMREIAKLQQKKQNRCTRIGSNAMCD